MQEIVISKGIEELLKLVFDFGKKKLEDTNLQVSFSEEDLQKSIIHHIKAVKNWAHEVTFNDLKSAKKTNEIFIQLDLLLYPLRNRIEHDEKIDHIPLTDLFNVHNGHIIILGQPGAGKTTSMKFLCNSIFFEEDFYPDKFKFPILIRLREFNIAKRKEENNSLIFRKLSEILNINFLVKNDDLTDEEFINNVKERFILDILDKLNVLIILDGFDELAFKKDREIIVNELGKLFNAVENSTIILTSRNSDFYFSLENSSSFEIAPLNDSQIKIFAEKWLNDKGKSAKFYEDIKKSPFSDTSIRPLNLAHLCAIFERIDKIPEKPKTVYRKIINLLLEEWDEQRGIVRKSKYSQFEVDRKFEFLSSLAYNLTTSYQASVFTEKELRKVYHDICDDFNLDRKEIKHVVKELESHTGLFIQVGYQQYEFSHKSLQEYLAAEYIVKLPIIPQNPRILNRIPNELAIAIAISSSPSSYLIELVYNRFNKQSYRFDFLQSFINRLLLEKPDFNYNDHLGMAYLHLYSAYLHRVMENHQQLKLFIFDNLTAEFEQFLKFIIPRTSFEKLKKYYNEGQLVESAEGDRIRVFQLKEDHEKVVNRFKKNTEDALPITLYCRDKLFEL